LEKEKGEIGCALMKGKISIKKLKEQSVEEKVEEFLKNSTENSAYSIQGIMMELFHIEEEDIKGVSFKDMKKGLPTLDSRIRRTLELLIKNDKIKKRKYSNAYYYYWKDDKHDQINGK